MKIGAPRFTCIPEPSRTWMVWDSKAERPAELGGCALSGRTEERARVACEILRRIYSNRLDACSLRKSVVAGKHPAAFDVAPTVKA
ncbi:hypothetical protein ACSBOB_21055 [Mesorhizobium sp. ASY16-5R]|jgi:hypothetical protein|uniref:hypothetical protein n=1 Tax=Mesorhizobium sp. ASY16-5R TaxID=3445772 RepID=UPI003FA162E7